MKTGRIFMPDATLDYIIERLGGTVTRELEGGEKVTVINLRERRYSGSNQTKLLILILEGFLPDLEAEND
jgi:hypothetical protein